MYFSPELEIHEFNDKSLMEQNNDNVYKKLTRRLSVKLSYSSYSLEQA